MPDNNDALIIEAAEGEIVKHDFGIDPELIDICEQLEAIAEKMRALRSFEKKRDTLKYKLQQIIGDIDVSYAGDFEVTQKTIVRKEFTVQETMQTRVVIKRRGNTVNE